MRYTVRLGDTLSKIAAAHGTTLEALLGANPRYRQQPERIQVGDCGLGVEFSGRYRADC
jgi:LysM repeat protein